MLRKYRSLKKIYATEASFDFFFCGIQGLVVTICVENSFYFVGFCWSLSFSRHMGSFAVKGWKI